MALAVRDYRFAPSVGSWQIELIRIAHHLTIAPDRVIDEVDREVRAFLDARPVAPALSIDRLRFAFALSLLHDITLAGGRVHVVDSQIYVSWPAWDAAGGRGAAQHALDVVASKRPLSPTERRRLSRLFLSAAEPAALTDFLRSGRFWLEPAEAVHPSGVHYSEAFAVALRLWRMPYRGREGRLRRFLLVGQHMQVAPEPVVAGLIEVGDEAPYSTERDQFLALRVKEAISWLLAQPDPSAVAALVCERIQRLRRALLPVKGITADGSARDVVHRREDLLRRAHGRSQTERNLIQKKRIAYLVRLAEGELAFDRLARGEPVPESDRGLSEGVRGMHDLTVPRVHMEVTVCGAVPPFANGLGGKLVVAFLAHPAVLDVLLGTTSSILRDIFDLPRLEKILPHWGLLALTTKGLYPGHSALYNRASVPASSREIRLRKIGETRGSTTNLLSARTGKLAHLVMEAAASHRRVSRTYGTGGAKRQRSIESAVLSIGLPGSFVHAGIRRPVYGLPLVSNLPSVVWAGDEPRWLIDRHPAPDMYAAAAVRLWRARWLAKAADRLRGGGAIHGVIEHFEEPVA